MGINAVAVLGDSGPPLTRGSAHEFCYTALMSFSLPAAKSTAGIGNAAAAERTPRRPRIRRLTDCIANSTEVRAVDRALSNRATIVI